MYHGLPPLQVGSRPIRPLGTVVLPEQQAAALLADCQEFLASEQWYAHHGIPYRRGYLLYGAPGGLGAAEALRAP
jgi:chaperone BCS1